MDTLEEQAQAEATEDTENDQETQPGDETENQDQENDQEESEESQNEDGTEEEGSQPEKDKLTKGMQKRLAKEKSRQYAIQAELDKEKEDKKALQAQLDARPTAPGSTAPVEPKPEDFPLGREDDDFIKADKAFTRYEIKQEIASEIKQQNQQSTQTQQVSDMKIRLKDAEDKHYERAGEINVDNYLETEKRAINIIGRDVADAIVMDFDASQDLLFHLGDNTEKAREVSEMFKQGKAVKGLLRLKEIHDEVRVKKKPKKFAADPEGEDEKGRAPSSSKEKRGPKGAKFY